MVDNRGMPTTIASTTENLNKLIAFRQAVYTDLGPARDALFELADAVLLMPHAQSLAELSESLIFRRRWPSVYEALQDSRLCTGALLRHYVGHVQPTWHGRVVLMGDHTAWSRVYARTLRDRTVEHQPNTIPGARPITVGQGYSTLAWVPEVHGSWALPLLHERIPSTSTPIQRLAQQLEQAIPQLAGRSLVLCDAEYGNAVFVKQTTHVACDKIVRLRSNLCLRTAPPPYGGRGRPAVHGRKFKFRDARTWGTPTETLQVSDPELGQVTIRRWDNLHFQKAAPHPLTVIRIEGDAPHLRRDRRVIWLAWLDADAPPIGQWWRLYFRRFAGDHWYRFAKQSLLWTRPRLKTPEQAERWSALMPLLTWQLWLARPIVFDKPRPWQKCQTLDRMTPGRVRQSLPALFAQIGTPACAPKLRGKSPGWLTGRPRAKAPRFPIVRKC